MAEWLTFVYEGGGAMASVVGVSEVVIAVVLRCKWDFADNGQ